MEVDSTLRTSRWQMTVYEPQYPLLETMPGLIAEWGWQEERCPKTDRQHRQGFLRTFSQQRLSALRKVLPGIHLEPAKNWNALIEYCKKSETRDGDGNAVHQTNSREYLTLDKALMKIAYAWDDDEYKRKCQPEYLATWKQKPVDVLKEELDHAICRLVAENPSDVSYYVRPDVQRAWVITHSVWLAKRQTDNTVRITVG